jgi:uncharacterized protein (DUF58 family)
MGDLSLFILLLLAVAFFLQIDFIFYVAYVCLGIFAWSQLVVPRLASKLILRRTFYARAFLGEKVAVRLEIQNSGWLPIPWVQVVESIPVQLRAGDSVKRVFSIGGKKSISFDYHVRAMRRGYYKLGPLLTTTGDLFGFQEKIVAYSAEYLTVYPRIISLSRLGFQSRLPFGTLQSNQQLFEDPARPAGVRSYRSGDSLRHINWKVSARNENLLVKTFQPAISLESLILLNLNKAEYSAHNRYDGPEWAIVVSASLAAHLSNQRQPVGLATNGLDPLELKSEESTPTPHFDDESGRLLMPADGGQAEEDMAGNGKKTRLEHTIIPPRSGREQLMKILERLARIEAAKKMPFPDFLPQACLNVGWGTTILAVTPSGGEYTLHALHRLVVGGYNPVLILVEPNIEFSRIREQARHLGFQAYHVAATRDLDKWRTTKFPYFRAI